MANFFNDDPFPIDLGADALFALTSPLPPTPVAPTPMDTSAHSTTNSATSNINTAASVNARKRQRTSASTPFSGGGGHGGKSADVIQAAAQGQLNNTRSQSSTPTPSLVAPTESKSMNSTELARKLRSDNPNNVIEALNFLLAKSADHEVNFALGRDGNEVMDALVELFDETIGWKHGNSKWFNDDDDGKDDSDIPSHKTWNCTASPSISIADEEAKNIPTTLDEMDWRTFCATRFSPSTMNTSMTPTHINPSYIMNEENDKDGIRVCEIITLILRNLTYVQANTRFVLHSIGILRILIGSLYFRNFNTGKEVRGPKAEREEDIEVGNSSSNMCLHAIHTFYNLAPNLDVTGRKIFLDFHLLDGDLDVTQSQTKASRYADAVDIKSYVDAEKCGRIHGMSMISLQMAKNFNVKDEVLTKIPDGMFRPVVKEYVKASLALFPAVCGLLRVRTSRSVVVGALEMLILLVDNPDNRKVFLHTPDALIHQLVHLLWIPRLGPDSIEYVDPLMNSVSRVSGMKLLGGYDIAVDYEIRDRSVEILQKLTDMSDDLKRKVGVKYVLTQTDNFEINIVKKTKQLNTRLYDAILPALTTRVGRDHTPQFAVKLLSNLASVDENLMGIMYAERKLLRAMNVATPLVSSTILNKVLNRI